jgi:hypothetical protein
VPSDPKPSAPTPRKSASEPPTIPWALIPLDDPDVEEYDPTQPAARSCPEDPRGRPSPVAIPWYDDDVDALTYHRRPLTPRPPEPRVIPHDPCLPES